MLGQIIIIALALSVLGVMWGILQFLLGIASLADKSRKYDTVPHLFLIM